MEIKASWVTYLRVIVESFLSFYLAIFCIALWFLEHQQNHLVLTGFLIILFIFITMTSIYRLIKYLSMPAIMLLAPIAPLIALIMIVTLIPVLQLFR